MRSALAACTERLRPLIGGASWVAAENLHITLKFLGRVDEPLLELIHAAIERAVAEQRSFDLTVAGLGVFPSASRARVIWAGVTEGAVPLGALAESVEREITPLGFPTEARGFSAHVTLARITQPRRDPNVARALEDGAKARFGVVRVERVLLMRSDLSPRGARYTELASSRLPPAGDRPPT